MQQIDLATIKAAKATDRKALAIMVYDNACADPAGANWRSVADMLRLAIPATKAKAATAEPVSEGGFAPWSEHDIPVFGHAKKFGKSPILVFTFADGEIVRAPAVSLPGKPVNLGRALKVAFAYYRGRMAHRCGAFSETASIVAVPEIVSAICETTGAVYDPADCSARTAELRSGSFDYAATLATAPEGAERADYLRTAYLVASHAARHPGPATEYSNHDMEAICRWTKYRPVVERAITSTANAIWITEGRAARLAWAVMTLWPDLADSELVPAPAAEIAPAAPVETAAPAAAPAAPSCAAEPGEACECPGCSSPFVTRVASKPRKLAPPLPAAPSYSSADHFYGQEWFSTRRALRSALNGLDNARACRLAFAVMTLWPDLTDIELSAVAEAAADPAPAPAAPSFKIPGRFLGTSRLIPVAPFAPATPSCILRIAA